MGRKAYSKNKKLFIWLFGLIFFVSLFFIIKSFLNSLFFADKERINLVVFENGAQFYSLDKKGEINYFLSFPADVRVSVPGGYGSYRVGGLLKLVSLEKNPELLKKTFTLATSSFIDYYFYPASDQIFYGFSKKENIFLPSLKQIFYYQSKAGFFDRLYLVFFTLKTPARKFIALPLFYDKATKNFSINDFSDKQQGIFYQSKLRNEGKNLQIIYHQSYASALAISNILEGEGIRVNDLSQGDKKSSNCFLLESKKKHSLTAVQIAAFFNCQLSVGETTPYDIIFRLNSSEKDWEIESKL
jgi:hypothetical protein